MPTSRFTDLVGIPERTYRRWQAKARAGRPPKGPWPTPAQDRIEPVAVELADRWPAWGHRKITALGNADGHPAANSTVLRALKRTGRVLPPDYTRERKDLAAARRAAFVVPPSGRNQVWQMDFTEYETEGGGIWRISGCADYWAKTELGWHVSMTQNHRDSGHRDRASHRRGRDALGLQSHRGLDRPSHWRDQADRRGLRQRPGVQG